MDQTRITGTAYDASGNPVSGVPIYISQSQKTASIIRPKKIRAATSDDDGEFIGEDDGEDGFLGPRASNATLKGFFFIGGRDFSAGVEVFIPDAATADLEDLGDPVTLTALGIPLSYLDTDGTLAANSDTKIATQKAVKTYVDAQSGGGGISESLAIAYAIAL